MIKKSLFLIILSWLLIPDSLSAAQTATVNGVTYSYNSSNSTAKVLKWLSSATKAEIPKTVSITSSLSKPKTYRVTGIEIGAFQKCDVLTEIILNDNFTTIDNYAFSGAKALTTIIIPTHIRSIGDGAFKDCASLESLTIPDNVTSIGQSAFKGCTNLKYISLPSTLDKIPSGLFEDCQSLSQLNIPSSVTLFEELCFKNTGFTSFAIPENITKIGQNIFEACKELSTVTFPKTITSIPAGMFKGCTALSSFKSQEKLNTIFNSAFYGCTSLTEINDPAHYIYFNAFENCTGLKKATVSDAAKQMFKGCTALESVTIFDNEISESMFEGCTSLKSVSLLGSRTTPTGVKSIGVRAFFGCESLTSAPLSGVSIINSNAFANCKNLTTVSLPTSITTVNTNAFDFTTVTKLVINPVLGNKSTPNNNAYQFLPSAAAGLTIYAHRIDRTFIEKYWKGEVKYFEDTDITSSSSLLCGIDFTLNTSSENIYLPVSSISYGKPGEVSRNLNINSDNKYSIRDLQPEETYYIYVSDKNGNHTYAFKTPTPTVIFKNSTTKTQTSLGGTVTASSDESVKPICYILDKECINGQATIITGLVPGNQYTLKGRADYNGKSFYSSYSYTTATDGMNPKITVKATPTRLIFEGTYSTGSATVTNFGFLSSEYLNDFDKEHTKVIKGLEPGDIKWAHFGVKVAENPKAYKVSISGTTVDVTWSEGDFIATSTKSVRLRVATNCDAETGTGIEWRRNDAPDNVKSTYVACPVVDGILVGSLRNLNPEVYYKFRPVYETSSGKKYYGKWAGFYSGDASVYFDPEVRTLEDIEVFENSALVACYIMPGSDDVKRQGIQYWHKGSPKGRANAPLEITTSEIKSTVTIPDLQPGTEYAYRAFAVTETGTIYGEEKSFVTKGTSGIDCIIDNQENNLTVTLIENPTVTPIRFSVSGTSAESIEVAVASMSGAIITRRHIPLDAEILSLDINAPHGVYLLSVNDGVHQSTSRVIIR